MGRLDHICLHYENINSLIKHLPNLRKVDFSGIEICPRDELRGLFSDIPLLEKVTWNHSYALLVKGTYLQNCSALVELILDDSNFWFDLSDLDRSSDKPWKRALLPKPPRGDTKARSFMLQRNT